MCLITSDCGISLPVACSDNVFEYRCIVQVHRLVWPLILQGSRQQPVDSAARGSFECYHPTSAPVSVYHYRSCVSFLSFTLPVIISCIKINCCTWY